MNRKRTPLVTALMLGALGTSVWAQTQIASNNAPANPAAATTSPAAPQPPVTAADIQALKDAIAAQQQQIEILKEQLQQTSATHAVPASVETPQQPPRQIAAVSVPDNSAPSPAVPSPTPQGPNDAASGPAPQNVQAGSSDERIRNLEREIKGLGPISFSGDIRLRAEPFFGGPSDQSQDRARARIRVRFNALADLGSQFRAGITLASGDLNDPTSTNQTLTGFYTRKPVALDQAFIEFHPSGFKALTLVGGKFRYPWFNTELTWDKDLNPEGAAETLGFKFNTPVLKRIALVGFQLPFAEIAGTSSTNKRIAQQITYGGQLQTQWQLGSAVTLSAYSGFYDFRGADSVALALAKANSKNPQTPLSGLLPLNSGNPVQDSTYVTTASTIITIDGTAYPTGVSTVSNAQFASKFALFDNIAKLDINTGHPKAPISFIGDYVQNTEACANLANIQIVPVNTSTTTYKQAVNATCKSNQRRGYWAEGRVGRLQQKGDFQFGYTHLYIEREAVLGNFNYSDIRQGTNVTQHRFDMFYQFDRSVQLGFTALVGRPLASTEPWLARLQFDSVYIF
jgi:hypothetical protein